MSGRQFDFRTSSYFPGSILFLGAILALVGIVAFVINIFVGVVLVITSVIIFTTHYRLSMDLDEKSYHDYLWILGFKSGDKGKFEAIEYIFIKKRKMVQRMSSRVNSSTIHSEDYHAFLKFSEDNKIDLMSLRSKEKLIGRLTPIAKSLSVDIIDYSDANL